MKRVCWLFFLFPLILSAGEVPTSEVVLFGRFERGPIETPVRVEEAQFEGMFGSGDVSLWPAEVQARQFFRNGGGTLEVVRLDPELSLLEALVGKSGRPVPRGLGWIEALSDIGLLLVPEVSQLSESGRNQVLARLRPWAERRHFMVLLDPPDSASSVSEMVDWVETLPEDLYFGAVYFPRVLVDPAVYAGESSAVRLAVGASGSAAGRIVQNDTARGIWRSPAGANGAIAVEGLEVALSDRERGDLNLAHVNPICEISGLGNVLFGARTLDVSSVENRYLAVVRTERWIVQSLRRSLSFAALEENDAQLWARMRTEAEQFLLELFYEGAFAGSTQEEAFFVRCGPDTTTEEDIANRQVNLLWGVALTRPEEFVVSVLTLDTLDPGRTPEKIPVYFPPPVEGVCTVFYPTSPGFSYTVETSDNLAGSWVAQGTDSGDGAWLRAVFTQAGPQRFLRIRVER